MLVQHIIVLKAQFLTVMLKPNRTFFLSFVSLRIAPALNQVNFASSAAHIVSYRAYDPTLRSNILLNDLSKAGRLEDARRLFDEIPNKDEYSWNTMIAAYCNLGKLDEAREVFDGTPYRGLVAWSSLVSGYCRNGRDDEGFRLFWELQSNGQRPSEFTIGSVLRSCTARGIVGRGEEMHGYATKTCYDGNIFVVTGLVDMYSKCGRVPEAERLFEGVAWKSSNHVLWSAMITGYMRNSDGDGAMRCFRDMTRHGIEPNQFTFPCVLTACADASARAFGVQVHCCVLKSSLGQNTFVQSALVNMYVKCGDMSNAVALIDTAEIKDVVSWNSMIVGSASQGFDEEALSLFRNMHSRGTKMDDFTYPSVLKSSACVMDLRNSKSVHCTILKNGFAAYRLVSNALIDMYSKQRDLASALEILRHMSDRDVISWTSLVTGYAHNEFYEEAIKLYCEMKIAGIHPDDIVTASILSSAAELTLLEFGQQVHGTIYKSVYGTSTSVVNALVSLYAKCGCLEEASQIFDSMQRRDVITWTALIVGYAQNGKARNAVELYKQMVSSHIKPDYVAFIGLLFACSHAGLTEEGEKHFHSMVPVYQIKPGPEHYACMIDLLGRSGKLAEAKDLLNRMDVEPDATTWKALLSACRVHKDRELAERAAKNLFRLEPTNSVPYVLLANIYFTAGEFEDAARIRKLMKSKGISKEPGCSWITINSRIHTFASEDRCHPKTAEIYVKVQEMMLSIKKAGYVPDINYALHDTDREEKELGLAYHSEKLAVAFGLLYVSPGVPIRVFKNLRVCGDCHTAMRYISRVYSFHIILRDSNCFHHFREGTCSCGDYW